VGCVECNCSKGYVAFSGAEAGEGNARNAQASLEYLGASVFDLIVVGVCCRIAWRMVWVIYVGMRVSGMLVDHLAWLLAMRSRI